MCGPFAKGLEQPIGPTASHLAPDRTVDLAPLNISLATAYHRAQNRQVWSTLVGTATSITGQAIR